LAALTERRTERMVAVAAWGAGQGVEAKVEELRRMELQVPPPLCLLQAGLCSPGKGGVEPLGEITKIISLTYGPLLCSALCIYFLF
jgi:hypothetical protein